MKDIRMQHPKGPMMETWVTEEMLRKQVVPEVNQIWASARIRFSIEQVFYEPVTKAPDYEEQLEIIINAKRDSRGKSDPARLKPLFNMMDPDNRSPMGSTHGPLYHIYLFPFIGNTSQGNAMAKYGYHSVVGVWTNKHNRGEAPEPVLLSEPWQRFRRGSLARTIAHELGHVLGLRHKTCEVECLMSGTVSNGYLLTERQIVTARQSAMERLKQNFVPMSYRGSI